MAKKTLIILFVFMLSFVPGVCIAQALQDSICLPVYVPNEAGRGMLNNVVSTKHRFLNESGVYLVYRNDSIRNTVEIDFDSTWWLEYDIENYYGCIIYEDKLFLLSNSLKKIDRSFLKKTNRRKPFPQPQMRISAINDRKVTWTFQLIDGKFERTLIYPPGEIFEFE